MTATILRKPDSELQQDILDELYWDPEVRVTDVGVEVNGGVVTLSGTVNSFTKKVAAERAALRVAGVRAVAENVHVKAQGERTDTDIAAAVADAFARDPLVPNEDISVRVENGWVTISGAVEWQHERAEAEHVTRPIRGVLGVTNAILLKPAEAKSDEIRAGIQRALVRDAQVDADRISVQVDGGQVTLSGSVRSWAEREEAEQSAWRGSGVTMVRNEILVEPYWEAP